MNQNDENFDVRQIIGEVCIVWSEIEMYLGVLACHLATARDFAYDDDNVREIFSTPVVQLDIRGKIALNKALAHEVKTVCAPDLYERTAELLNHIDYTLRPERNRFVHDYWGGAGTITRYQTGIRIERTQSRKTKLSLETRREFPSAAVVHSFLQHLEDSLEDLIRLDDFACSLSYGQKLSQEPPQQLPATWNSLTHRDWQSKPPS